ncbi:MAG: urea carboxylase-associated family protein [Nitrincola lacisaponensis]|uniref:urea carboxylase-associated family protein n=1 Tax=Nitrincola lacisaponensis TaxID=267850 RepID=UPI0039192EDB
MTKMLVEHQEPEDAETRRAIKPVICYPTDTLPPADLAGYQVARKHLTCTSTLRIPPREARSFTVPAGTFFRIVSVEGPQVGDLNLFNQHNLQERFYAGKTRALHGTHLSTGDRLWSTFPYLRPLATITCDTLDWYGFDADGGSVHDVIGTRCDPYTHRLLSGQDYDHCCHSNLYQVVRQTSHLPDPQAEQLVHDVLNVFMCTGFTRDTHQYFMKASPVRPGDYLEFFAEVDLLGVLSACPGGDCSSEHSSDLATCYPLEVQLLQPEPGILKDWRSPEVSGYHHPD